MFLLCSKSGVQLSVRLSGCEDNFAHLVWQFRGRFSHNVFLLKKFSSKPLPPVKTSCPLAENANEAPCLNLARSCITINTFCDCLFVDMGVAKVISFFFRSLLFGDISPKDRPEFYIKCVHSVYQTYAANYRRKIPLIVNTQGWVKGEEITDLDQFP